MTSRQRAGELRRLQCSKRAYRRQIINLDFIENVELGVNGVCICSCEGPEVEISRRQVRLFKPQKGIKVWHSLYPQDTISCIEK